MKESNLIPERSCRHRRKIQKVNNSFEPVLTESLLLVYQQMNSIQPNIESTPEIQKNEFNNLQFETKNKAKEQENDEELDEVKELPTDKQMTRQDLMIKQLRQNNRMITQQVQAIWQKMKQYPEPSAKKRRLIESQDSYEKLQKDLKNANHWIKIVEKQLKIHKKREKQSSNIIENIRKCRKDLSEREAIIFRLKSQFYSINRQIKQKDKIIQNKVNPSIESNNQIKILNDEVNHLFEMVQDAERKEQKRVNTLKKQYTLVKKMQKDLVEKGMSQGELDELKKSCIMQVPNRTQISNKRTTLSQSIQIEPQYTKPKEVKQKKTKKKLNEMMLQIKILEKKQTQFENQYSIHDTVRMSYRQKNKDLRAKIEQSDIQIERLELLSEKLRSKHIFQHRRKTRLKSLEIEKVQKQKEMAKKQMRMKLVEQHKSRKRRIKSMPHHEILFTQKQKEQIKSTVDSSRMPQRKRCEEFGESSEGATKFNDKYVIDREMQGKKITGICIYFSPQRDYISGLNVIYDGSIKGGEYVLKNKDSTDHYKIQTFQCSDTFIKDIFPEFTKHNQKSRLVGLTLQLSNGEQKQLGQVVPFRSALTDREYVSTLYGSMGIIEFEGGSLSVIEELGMEIYE